MKDRFGKELHIGDKVVESLNEVLKPLCTECVSSEFTPMEIYVKKEDIFSICTYGIECLSCHEIVEFDDYNIKEVVCPYCQNKLIIKSDE